MNVRPKAICFLTRRVRDSDVVEQTQSIAQVSACVQLARAIEHGVGRTDNRQRFARRLWQRTRVGRHIDEPRQCRCRAQIHRGGDRNEATGQRYPGPCATPRRRNWLVGHAARRNSFALQREIKPCSLELLHASEQHQRLITGGALIDGARQQVARTFDLSGFVRLEAAMQELLRLALTLRDGLARAIDVRAGTIVIAVEKDDARPDVDRLFVFSREVVIQTGNEKCFDARRALGGR